jgi:uncharacterized protein
MNSLNKIGMGLGIFILLILVWGLVEPYFIDVEQEEAVINQLPEEWEGKQIAVLGDYQVGMWMDNTATVKKTSKRIAEMDPAAVLILGDFVYHAAKSSKEEMDHVKELLSPLTEKEIPIFAVLGNHDYAMKLRTDEPNSELAENVASELNDMGIEVLHNESVALELTENGVEPGNASENSLYLAGIGAAWPDEAQPDKAFEAIPETAARMVMMHNPDTFAKLEAGSAPFAVAGHTHGGQVRIPFTPESTWMTYTKKENVHADGWIEDYGAAGNKLYVNRGIGFSDIPIRINCPPEVTLFTLKTAS